MQKNKRKSYFPHLLMLLLAAIIGSSLLLSGCGNTTKEAENPSSPSAPAAASGPVKGGEINVPLNSDPPTLLVGAQSRPEGPNNLLYPGLVQVKYDRSPEPYIAESWDISPDSKKVTFHLRKDIKWHDGVPLTSDDVRFTFEEVSAKLTPQLVPVFKQVESIETPDDYTITLNFSQPYGPLFNLLGAPFFGVLPKHLLEGKDLLTDPDALFNTIGSGPYKMGEWRRGEYIVFERNEDFWDKSKPYLDRIVYRIISDQTARLNAFETGEIDQIDAAGILENVSQLEARPDVEAREGVNNPSEMDLSFNMKNPILANFEVRKAIYQAIDRKMINQMVYLGLGRPGTSYINPDFGALYDPSIDFEKMYPYDPKKAEEILDQAGYPRGADGTRFSLNLTTSSLYSDWQTMQEMIVEFLRQVGIKVNADRYDDVGIIQRIFKDHNFDMLLFSTTAGADPIIGVERWFRSDNYGTGRPFVNNTGYANPQVDALFEKARTSAIPEERAKAFHEIQQITSKELPFLKIVNPPSIYLVNTRVQNFIVDGPYISERVKDAWIKQ